MKKKLREAIENIDMVNNIDGQDFGKEFVGTAPVSYADAVLRARKHREDAKKGCKEQTKLAKEVLKKEISNAEHPEPLDKIKANEERKMTLDEGLFESFDDEHLGHGDDVCPKCRKNPCECKIEEGAEEKRVYRVTYKHSPEVFSSVMVKAANEDEAKQKLAVKKPGKDIVGVSVMSDDEVNDMTNRGMSLMEAKVVDDFSSYEPWDAAVSTFDNIQNAGKMDALEQLIDDMYPDGIDRTELNDLLAFESDWVYSMLDMPNEEDVDEEGEDGPAIDFEEEE